MTMSAFQARQMDESAFFVLDTTDNALHGADGGPFPYQSKAAAFSVASRRNGRFDRNRRFVVVTWLNLKQVS